MLQAVAFHVIDKHTVALIIKGQQYEFVKAVTVDVVQSSPTAEVVIVIVITFAQREIQGIVYGCTIEIAILRL